MKDKPCSIELTLTVPMAKKETKSKAEVSLHFFLSPTVILSKISLGLQWKQANGLKHKGCGKSIS